MAEYQWAASVSDIEPGSMFPTRVNGKALLLVNIGGEIYAMSDFCTHQKCYLHDGKLKEKTLTCPCHFADFDVTTGTVLAGPAKMPLPMYPVKVEGDDVLVEI